MRQVVDSPVSVTFSFNHYQRSAHPQKILWAGREYLVSRIGLHHTHRRGRTLYHTFSVVASGHFFRLTLDTDNLFWQLEEVSDGLPE